MDLMDCRDKIDRIDDAILKLFISRMKISAEIGAYKKEHALPALDPLREHEKLLQISEKSPEELREYSAALFCSLMDISRNFQNKILCADEEA